MKTFFKDRLARIDAYLSSEVLSFRALLRIVVPVFWEQAFLALLSIAGIWMLSRDGEGAVSVVNMMQGVNKVFTSLCLGLVTGGTVLVAQNVGAKREGAAGHNMGQSLMLALLVTSALSAGLLIAREPLTAYLLSGADRTIVSQATQYFTGFCISFPCYALYQSIAGGLRGFGLTALAWRITLTANLMELALTALLLVGLRMGVMGVTLALIGSRLLGAAVALYIMRSERGRLQIHLKKSLRPDPLVLRRILIIAIPLALEQFFFNSGKAISQRFIAGYGTTHMAANGVINALFDLYNLPQISLREALVIVASMCIGSGRPDLARQYIHRFMRVIRYLLIGITPLMIPLMALFFMLYGLSPEANRIAAWSLWLIYAASPLFIAGSLSAPAGLRAGGDATFVSATALGSMWLVRVTLSWLLVGQLSLGVFGLNLAMVIEWAVRNVIFRIRLRGDKWYAHRLIDPPGTKN